MTPELWTSLVLLFGAGGLTPGPAVMLVMAASLRHGFVPSLWAAIGVSTANVFWIALAASGVAVLATQFPVIFLGLKIAGIGFILWLAWTTATRSVSTTLDEDVRDGTTARVGGRRGLARYGALFAQGFGLQVANPNALVFFGGLLPAFFDASRPLAPQVTVMILTVTATEMTGLSIYGGMARALSRRFARPRFARGFYVCAALVMAGSAIWAVTVTV